VEQLRQTIRACLAGESQALEVVLAAINRRGKAIQCKVSCTPLVGIGKEIWGVIMLMEELLENE
jgi:two-component system CheB/CheR fusion protein